MGGKETKGTNHQVGSRHSPYLNLWQVEYYCVLLLDSTSIHLFHLLTLCLEHARLQDNFSAKILLLTGITQPTGQGTFLILVFLLSYFVIQSSLWIYESGNKLIFV